MDYLDNPIYSEQWKPIDGYEEYLVSNFGRVKSLKKYRGKKENILKQAKDKQRGYLHVALSKSNKTKGFLVHRLVANAFIPNLMSLPQVNHKDENKENNHVDNLEWCENKYNLNYGSRNKKISDKYGRKIIQKTINNEFIAIWNGTCMASRTLKINEGNIWEACNKKRKTAGGYKWEYLENKKEND